VSSAILYVAIVAIWAFVLVPRLLRRDSVRGASGTPDEAAQAAGTERTEGTTRADGAARAGGTAQAGGTARAEAAERQQEAAERQEAAPEAPKIPPRPPTPEESRQRALAARRRLLGMLLALEIAAMGLAVLGLAALWVVIPPSIMLGGYLLLLREAAHADAERAAREGEATARARARARQQARARARAAARPAATAATVAPPAPAPAYEDMGPGRDFAPGLAGKYTTSNAEATDTAEQADDGYYEQYTETRLRAVGD
jgi:hypothetical protein